MAPVTALEGETEFCKLRCRVRNPAAAGLAYLRRPGAVWPMAGRAADARQRKAGAKSCPLSASARRREAGDSAGRRFVRSRESRSIQTSTTRPAWSRPSKTDHRAHRSAGPRQGVAGAAARSTARSAEDWPAHGQGARAATLPAMMRPSVGCRTNFCAMPRMLLNVAQKLSDKGRGDKAGGPRYLMEKPREKRI